MMEITIEDLSDADACASAVRWFYDTFAAWATANLPIPWYAVNDHDLSGIDLAGAGIQRLNFTAANLRDATLDRVCACGTMFDRADLAEVSCARGDFARATFRAVDACDADFHGAILSDADFRNAWLGGVVVDRHADLTDAMYNSLTDLGDIDPDQHDMIRRDP